MGQGVIIDKDQLSPDERVKFDKGWEDNAYNQYVSDMISLHRSIPDIRDAEYVDNLNDQTPNIFRHCCVLVT
jgi:hypothetical protein